MRQVLHTRTQPLVVLAFVHLHVLAMLFVSCSAARLPAKSPTTSAVTGADQRSGNSRSEDADTPSATTLPSEHKQSEGVDGDAQTSTDTSPEALPNTAPEEPAEHRRRRRVAVKDRATTGQSEPASETEQGPQSNEPSPAAAEDKSDAVNEPTEGLMDDASSGAAMDNLYRPPAHSADESWAYQRATRRVSTAKESLLRQALRMRATLVATGTVCSSRCELADGICQSRDVICEVASQYQGDRRFEADCAWARDECLQAQDQCTRCYPGDTP